MTLFPAVSFPQRIASLSTEAVDVLYRLGAEDRVVGVSGYTHYPRRARETKPKVSGFKTGKLEKILSVQPDLVIGYSHVQRRLLDEVDLAGVPTRCYHHRNLAGIHEMVTDLGELVGARPQAQALSRHLLAIQAQVAVAASRLPFKPRVYFEEWHTPLTCGIHWVSELITLAGGVDVFADRAPLDPFSARAVTPEEVLQAQPQLILGSWCGQRFDTEAVQARPGFAALNALVLDIPSSDILAPGPVAIERGLVWVFDAVCRAAGTMPEALGFTRPELSE
ncbi:ABC transporter substrate-binding protein [Aquabacterium sp.]|uniref:ABC transporter substrate-binding protein n=1 Tax=Aquabacterium sp. TaxID=1872578 RepID=UPI0025C63245|nr:ABC transporter substrate-binding protein [Aquabacterium sp.]